MARFFSFLLWILLTYPPVVSAEGKNDLLFLITETIVRAEQEPVMSFWWSDGAEPNWTQTDDELAKQLLPLSVVRVSPASGERISSIYRRSDLSPKQRVAFATVLGAGGIIAGEAVYEESPGRYPLMGVSCRAQVEVGLLDTDGGKEHVIRIARVGHGVDWDEAYQSARGSLARGLSRSVAASMGRHSIRTGLNDDKVYLEVHGAQNLAQISAIERHLNELPIVRETVIRWVGPRRIAFELNSGDANESPDLRAVIESLAQGSFAGFTLAVGAESKRPEVFSVEVVPAESEEVRDGR